MEIMCTILFRDTPIVRINDTFAKREMATDLFESNLMQLNMLYQQGSESFAKHETALRKLLSS